VSISLVLFVHESYFYLFILRLFWVFNFITEFESFQLTKRILATILSTK